MEILGKNTYRIEFNDKEYPDKLREINNPPKELFAMGNLELLNKDSIAVVGSRKASEYGKQVSLKIGKALADNGITHVSGMAKGIDRYSHVGAMKNGGNTIAVLGSGVDVCYPRENQDIYDEIKMSGLILSELPMGAKPEMYTFPMRNRIISGLSLAVVIAEANSNSGSLITAQHAIDQGKTVFAVPGSILSHSSLGTNKLIHDGANIVTVVDDIFTELGIAPKVSVEDFGNLGDDERLLIEIIREEGEISIERLCLRLNMSPVSVNSLVSILEIKGILAYDFGKVFMIKG